MLVRYLKEEKAKKFKLGYPDPRVRFLDVLKCRFMGGHLQCNASDKQMLSFAGSRVLQHSSLDVKQAAICFNIRCVPSFIALLGERR